MDWLSMPIIRFCKLLRSLTTLWSYVNTSRYSGGRDGLICAWTPDVDDLESREEVVDVSTTSLVHAERVLGSRTVDPS